MSAVSSRGRFKRNRNVDPRYGIDRLVRHLRSRLPTLSTNRYFVTTAGGAPLAFTKQYIENQKAA